MCDGVAARLDDTEALFDLCRTLRDEFGVKNIQTFMCNGVAARLDDKEHFFILLRMLLAPSSHKQERVTIEEITSLMNEISPHLDLAIVAVIRKLKYLITRTYGRQSWLSSVRRPYSAHLHRVLGYIERCNDRSEVETIFFGNIRVKRVRLNSF